MITRKEVADRAGVSVAVVSYVLNNRSIVKEETRQKVLAVINELGYRPNQTARSLKTRKTGQIAVLVHFLGNPFEGGLLLYIEKKAKLSNYSVFFHSFEPAREEELKNTLMGRVDGILLLGQTLSEESQAFYSLMELPIVSLMHPGIAMPSIPVVDVDWIAEIRRLIVHLREQGHEQIAFMTAGDPQDPIAHRLMAFREAMHHEGLKLPEPYILEGAGRFERAFEVLTTTFTQGFDFTAIVAANDLMAAGCLAACRESGILVPQQLAVAGCEDILMSSQVSPALTAICYPRMEVGLAATELLLSLIDGENKKTPRLEGKLSVRASTVENSMNATSYSN